MNFTLKIIAIAVGLGMDAMSVCAAIGVRWHGPRQKFRLAFHMGLFQFLMPILGYLAGHEMAGFLKDLGGYLAAALVVGVGAKMLYEAVKAHHIGPAEKMEQAEKTAGGSVQAPAMERSSATADSPSPPAAGGPAALARKDPTRGWSLVGLSLATSIDALVVGFSMGLRSISIWAASLTIGLIAAAMALTGVFLGQHVGKAFGRWAEILGAVILIGLGITFLWL